MGSERGRASCAEVIVTEDPASRLTDARWMQLGKVQLTTQRCIGIDSSCVWGEQNDVARGSSKKGVLVDLVELDGSKATQTA